MTIEDYGGIVSLSEEQYTLLKLNGQIEVEGVTIIYSPTSTAYAIKDTRTLLAPKSAPLENQIVAVNPEGKQQMLNVGEGLSVENGTLKASGGSGGSKLYRHNILIQAVDYTNNMNIEMGVTIINSDNTVFNYDTFSTHIANNAESVSNRYFNIHGYAASMDDTTPGILAYLYIDTGIIRARFMDMVNNSVNDLFIQPTSSLITDNLVEV